MAKRKPPSSSHNDTKIAAIVTGLFAAFLILLFIYSKANESHKQQTAIKAAVTVPLAVENPAQAPRSEEAQETLENVSGQGPKRIAFIIDDWGYTTANCKYLAQIPEPLAISILPGLRHTQDAANCALRNHKLAMLHLPLEAMQNFDFYYPHDYIIKTTMPPSLVSKIVEEDLDQVPSIEGVNNHMGSRATANRALMKIILRKLKNRGLFFVDSMTSPRSVSAGLAEEMGLRFAKRDVFLDNVNTRQAIVKQLEALARVARRKGYAVAIGHDRHLTMQVLKDEIPLLEKQGFEIVSIKELLKSR